MTTREVTKRPTILRGEQELDDGDDDIASGSLRTVDMSFLSNATSFVDGSGVGHVKVNDSMDWSDILPNDTTVHIIYQGSGSNEEVLIIPVNETASESTDSSSSGSSGSGSMSGNSTANPIDSLPTGSSSDSSSGDSDGVVGTGSNPTTLVIVASVLALIAIVAIFCVVMYGRRKRRRAFSEDPDEPFIVGSLPHQPVPQLSLLDTDITPDLWVEGQYQYSPNMSGMQNSLNGTAILSDNNTTSSHRLTVDGYPFGPNTQRGRRDNAHHDNTHRGRRDNAPLDDISERGRRRMGTTPVVLYEEDAIDEHKTNSSRKYYHQRQPSQQQRQPSQQQRQPSQQQRQPSQTQRQQRQREREREPQQQRQREREREPQQQRMNRRDKYATRRDRR